MGLNNILGRLTNGGLLRKTTETLSLEEMAEILRTSPETLDAFEKSYKMNIIEGPPVSDDLFATSKKQAETVSRRTKAPELKPVISRSVNELLSETELLEWDGTNLLHIDPCPPPEGPWLTNEDLRKYPEDIRPQLTGRLISLDTTPGSAEALLFHYRAAKTAKTEKERRTAYWRFRQGLDILDLDPVLYAVLGQNPNSMGHWLPALVFALRAVPENELKIPKTKVMRVPIPVLQLARLDYASLRPATLAIVNRFCHKAFGLEDDKEYFVKTGIFSSKFDFRNAHVKGRKEVRELGEYLLYIHNRSVAMAGPLIKPAPIVGAAATREWVVREWIPDAESNPEIYMGLPLRTEYRVFVDCNKKTVLGAAPYWDPETMEKRFKAGAESGDPRHIHDAAVYMAHRPVLMERYRKNLPRVLSAVNGMLPTLDLPGQWSLDIMQDKNDLWAIDMATADSSALSDYVPKCLLRPFEIDWIPSLDGPSRGPAPLDA